MGKKIDTFVRSARNTPHARTYGALHCALSLISILALTQTPRADSIEAAAPGTGNANSCNPSSSEFGADLKQLAETVTGRADIPPEFLQRHFTGCTIETLASFLAKDGFSTGDSDRAYGDREAGITRTVLASKTMQLFDQSVSLNCRIILQIYASNRLTVRGFFYFDGS